MGWLSFVIPQRLYRGTSKFNTTIEVIESFGKKQLLVNGIVQTGVYTHKLFAQGIHRLSKWHEGEMKQIVVFGIGGGDIFLQLHKKYSNADITGVDIDSEIIRIAKKYFHTTGTAYTNFIASDAVSYSERIKNEKKRFDAIIVDIYIGNDVPDFVTNIEFLRALKQILRNKGSLIINYFSSTNQQEKSQKILKQLQGIYSRVEMESNRRNIFYYCRA